MRCPGVRPAEVAGTVAARSRTAGDRTPAPMRGAGTDWLTNLGSGVNIVPGSRHV